MAAGSIVIDLLMKTGSFETNTKKASNSLNKFKKDAIDVGKAVAVTGAAITTTAAGIAAAWVKSTAETGKELDRLSKLSNTSAETFQKYAYAAKTVGIEQEKLSDIFKDFQDRVGDFITTGGGPMKDFFEVIAPKVGVTAEAFRNLSGPEAMGLFFDSLQKANLSQSELVFFMEAMASDSTLLIPLLKDNARGFRELGTEAERLGAIMNNETVKAAKELDANLNRLNGMVDNFKVKLANEALPVINDFIEELMNSSTKTDELGKSIKSVSSDTSLETWVKNAAKTLAGLGDVALWVGKAINQIVLSTKAVGADIGNTLGGMYNDLYNIGGLGSLFNPDEVAKAEKRRAKAQELRDKIVGEANKNLSELLNFDSPLRDALDRSLNKQNKPRDAVSETLKNFSQWGLEPIELSPISAESPAGRKPKGGGSKSDPAGDYIRQLNEQIALLGKETEYEIALANIQLGKYGALSQYQKDDILGKAQTLDLLKQAQEETEKYQAFIDDVTGAGALREHNKELEWLKKAWDEGAISAERYKELTDEITEKFNASTGVMSEFALQASRNIQDTLGNTLADVLKGNFDNIGKAWGDLIIDMVAQAAAANLNEALFGSSGTGGLLGGLLGSIFGGPANVGAVNASPVVSGFNFGGGGAYGFGSIGWSDGGYTGSGGKYEPAGIVHKGEVVWSQDDVRRHGGVSRVEAMRLKGYSNGGVVGGSASPGQPSVEVNVINNGQPMQAQTNTRFDGEKMIVDVVLKDLYVNGPISKAMAGVR